MLFFLHQNDTFRVVWSYSDTDPPEFGIESDDEDLFDSLPAGEVRSGSRSLHLYESTKLRGLRAQNDALKWKVQSNSVLLPPKDTLYWCTMLRLPELPGNVCCREGMRKNDVTLLVGDEGGAFSVPHREEPK